VPLARALPPVVAYRVANLLLPALPAMHAHRHIHAALRARERGHLRPRGAKHNGS
jgi:hypothetical protein